MSADLGEYALVGDRVAKVIAICDSRQITFEFVGGTECPTCGAPDRIEIVEGCLNWQHQVKPLPSVAP